MAAAAAFDSVAEGEGQGLRHAVIEIGCHVGALLAFVLGCLGGLDAIVQEVHVVLDA